ncbi:MAG: hypothetical protein Q6K31_06410 [Gloeomargarita sp. GMQP_bins_14]
MTVPAGISFEQAVAQTQTLVEARTQGKLDAQAFAQKVQALVQSENGARGFFVTYLTLEAAWADQPDEDLVQALKSAPAIVGELLVKNLVMATAMEITHRRNGDADLAQGSQRVQQRVLFRSEQLQLAEVPPKAREMARNAAGEPGTYSDFLQRWGYDDEQRRAIQQVLQPWVN